MRDREKRYLSAEACELRAADEGEAPAIEGYAARFGVMSEDLGFGREIIRAGAFKRTLDNGTDVVALWSHMDEYPLARRSTGGLVLEEDKKGLRVRIVPDDTSYARDLLVSIRSGTVQHMSFGFQTIQDEWTTEDGETVRELVEVHLLDTGPVTFPAYPQTSAAVRSLLEHEGAKTEEIQGYTELFAAIGREDLTGSEYRHMLGPIVLELRSRRTDPGPVSHSEQEAQRRTESVRRRFRLLEKANTS